MAQSLARLFDNRGEVAGCRSLPPGDAARAAMRGTTACAASRAEQCGCARGQPAPGSSSRWRRRRLNAIGFAIEPGSLPVNTSPQTTIRPESRAQAATIVVLHEAKQVARAEAALHGREVQRRQVFHTPATRQRCSATRAMQINQVQDGPRPGELRRVDIQVPQVKITVLPVRVVHASRNLCNRAEQPEARRERWRLQAPRSTNLLQTERAGEVIGEYH